MLVRIFAISAFILVGASMHSSIAAEVQDYPGLGRIQGYKIQRYDDTRFDHIDLPPPVEGHVITIAYHSDGSEPEASNVELARSYKTVIDGLGGEELSYDEQGGRLVARFTRNGQNVYVKLASNGAGEYILTVVEERPFRPMIQQSAPSSKP